MQYIPGISFGNITFGMSVQEASASAVPVVASDLIPYATEYLLGDQIESIPINGTKETLNKGRGAIVVPADNVDGFAQAILYLLENLEEKQEMGVNGYRITVPHFTWEKMTENFLNKIGFSV